MAPESSAYPVGSLKAALLDRLNNRTARIGIIGLGYVGLPLMLRFSEVGYRVTGFDIDETKVTRLNAGESYIERITSGTIRGALTTFREDVRAGRYPAAAESYAAGPEAAAPEKDPCAS